MIRVGGVCRSDVQLIDGYFQKFMSPKLPLILGHEISGWIEELGPTVPQDLFEKGDLVVVYSGWGCGICQYCKNGTEQICPFGAWAGFGIDGGYSEYAIVPSYRFLIKVDKNKYNLKPQELAPFTDACLTPYRAIKKARHLLGPGKTIAIFGIGGLGSYAVQHAKILSAESKRNICQWRVTCMWRSLHIY